MMSEFNEAAVHTAVRGWYAALDRHDDVGAVLPYVVDEGFEMHMPEGVFYGRTGFLEWYERVVNTFFDEEHTVERVDVSFLGEETAKVAVRVNWQARVWEPPEPVSSWLGFDARQTWTVVWQDDSVRVRRYVIEGLEAMPGSAPL
ncbi:SnoaL-like protein [Allonocardiopsis opalescens]|uniref:SnoaL-like protein n=2 Tax=Allonocardiopsis opalescens TaxID=1144618 RepID=A0A2T0PZV4_9ACTN|nr:SnoaL-like protein [Allonocardiopsis opalescens]